MTSQTGTKLVPTLPVAKLSAGDSFLERVQEVYDLIERRAYELFESSGYIHGNDVADWLRAESEILRPVPLTITETEAEVIVRAEMPGFKEKDLEVRVEPRRLFIAGQREQASEAKEGRALYSERRSDQIFRAVELPAEIDPDRAKAALGKGVLEVTLAKVETGKKAP